MKHILIFIFFFNALSSLNAVEREVKRGQTIITRNSVVDPFAHWQEVTDDKLCKSALCVAIDDSLLITFFKENVPESGFGISIKNKPVKQMFRYKNNERFIFSDTCTTSQSPNEGVAFIFEYNNPVVLQNRNYKKIVTVIAEDAKNSIHGSYDLIKE